MKQLSTLLFIFFIFSTLQAQTTFCEGSCEDLIDDECISCDVENDLSGDYSSDLFPNPFNINDATCDNQDVENILWFAFYAGSEDFLIEIEFENCSPESGMTAGLMDGCGGQCLAIDSEWAEGELVLEANDLVFGSIYAIWINGVCDFSVYVNSESPNEIDDFSHFSVYGDYAGCLSGDNCLEDISCSSTEEISACPHQSLLIVPRHLGNSDIDFGDYDASCSRYDPDLFDFVWTVDGEEGIVNQDGQLWVNLSRTNGQIVEVCLEKIVNQTCIEKEINECVGISIEGLIESGFDYIVCKDELLEGWPVPQGNSWPGPDTITYEMVVNSNNNAIAWDGITEDGCEIFQVLYFDIIENCTTTSVCQDLETISLYLDGATLPYTNDLTLTQEGFLSFSLDNVVLPNNANVEWWIATNPNFTPGLEGIRLVTASSESNWSSGQLLPELLSIGYKANNTVHDEYFVVGSGSGFSVNDLSISVDPNCDSTCPDNCVERDLVNAECWGSSNSNNVFNCDNIILVGNGDYVPPNSVLVVFMDDYENTGLRSLENLCSDDGCIYVMYNTCDRCLDAFSDSGSASYSLQLAGQVVSTLSYQGQAEGVSVNNAGIHSTSEYKLESVTQSLHLLEGRVNAAGATLDCSQYSGQQYIKGVVVSNQFPSDCCSRYTRTISVNIDCDTPSTTLEWIEPIALPTDMVIENGECMSPYVFPSNDRFGPNFPFPLVEGFFGSDCSGSPVFTSTHTPQSGFEEGVTTVTYTVTDDCGNRLTHSFTITIECDDPPPPPPSGDDEIFDGFPWLHNLVDRNDCDDVVITLYESGIFNFLHVQTADSGILYFQDGVQYCQDSPGFSCVAAYGLGQAVDSWECDGGVPPGPAPDLSLFSDYPFLSGLIDLNNCEGTTVNVYELGSFEFLHIQTVDSGILYFEDGTKYCTDSPTLDCVIAYNLGTAIRTWTCGDTGGGGGGSPTTPVLFEDYPWLSDVVDLSDCGETEVSAYKLGSVIFLFVDVGDGLMMMYSEAGQFYCGDSPGFSCFDAYGFDESDLVDRWSCDGLYNESIENRSSAKETFDYNIYPNPTTGRVMIDGLQEGSQIMVYDLNGTLVRLQNQKFGEFDLQKAANGIYLIMIEYGAQRSFHRVVKL